MSRDNEFDPEIQHHIMALMAFDPRFLKIVAPVMKPLYFAAGSARLLVEEILAYYRKYKSAPEEMLWLLVKQRLARDRQGKDQLVLCREVWETLKEKSLDKSAFALDEVSRFIRRTMVQHAMVNCIELYRTDKYEEIADEMEKAVRAGDIHSDIGHLFFQEIDKRVAEAAMSSTNTDQMIRTMIPGLDDGVPGFFSGIHGVARQELLVFLAVTGVGKSFVLRTCGHAAVFQGCHVSDISLEMPQVEVTDRYDTAFLGKTIEDLQLDPALRYKIPGIVRRAVKDPMLVVKQFPTRQCSVDTLKSYFEQLARYRVIPNYLIVDYAGIMAPTRRYTNRVDELASIFEELKGFAMEYDIPVVTAAQANRKALSKEVVSIQDFAESFKSCGIANVIISICQTIEEKEKNELRLFVTKNRRAKDGQMVYLKYDYSTVKFVLDQDRMEEKEEERKRLLAAMKRKNRKHKKGEDDEDSD